MQNHRGSADFEGGIKGPVSDFAERARSNQGNYNSAPIAVELRRLDNNDERDAVFVISQVSMDVELRHQSDEYSSLNEPDFTLKSFHIFTVASNASDFANRSSRALAK
jgi:hypothetical protein